MEQWFEKLGWKRVGAATIFVFILILIFAGLYFISGTREKKTVNELTNKNTSNSTNQTNNPTISPTIAAWKDYSNIYFKISYPPNFEVSDGILPDGGTSTTLLSQEEKILIETFNSQVLPPESVINGFTSMGYGQSTVSLGAINATEISGSRLNIMSEKGYIFESGGRTYKIIFTYGSPKKDVSREQIFDSIMSTFSLYR